MQFVVLNNELEVITPQFLSSDIFLTVICQMSRLHLYGRSSNLQLPFALQRENYEDIAEKG